jgi:hypothetical protein
MDLAFRIPAGAQNHVVASEIVLEEPLTIHGAFPHMHFLGQWLRYEAVFPGGRTVTLLAIEDWDFDFQLLYEFAAPIAVPKGTILRMKAGFDNSSGNPRNPNRPPKDVFGSINSTDEMLLVSYLFTRPAAGR